MKKLITTLGILGLVLGFTILPAPSASHSWGTAVFAQSFSDSIKPNPLTTTSTPATPTTPTSFSPPVVNSFGPTTSAIPTLLNTSIPGANLYTPSLPGASLDSSIPTVDQVAQNSVNSGPGVNYTKSAADSFTETLALFFSYIIHGLVYVSWMIIGMIGPFLGNDIVFSPSVTPLLHQLWSLVRDLVNIGFAFVLIAMAFKLVFSDGDDKLKKALPKFIVSLVGVNFSWLGMKLLVDLATVLTIFIFSLPSMVLTQNPDFCGKNLDNNGCYMIKSIRVMRVETTSAAAETTKKAEDAFSKAMNDPNVPFEEADRLGNVVHDTNFSEKTANIYQKNGYMLFSKTIRGGSVVAATKVSTGSGSAAKPEGVSDAELKSGALDTVPAVLTITLDDTPIKPDSINPTSVAPLIAYNMLHLDLLGKVNITNQNLLQVIVNDFFGIIFAILYAIAFVGLFVALVTRVIVAWVVIILSPLYPLSIATGDLLKIEGGKKIFDMAINNIFVSVKVAVPLTAGWIFMAAFSQLGYKPGMSGTLPPIFTLTFDPQSPLANLPLLSNILFQIIGVMIMWKGMQWAIKDSEAKSFIENKIYKPVGAAGGWMSTLPLKAQILPGVKGGSIAGTMGGAMATLKAFDDRVSAESREKGQAGARMLGISSGVTSEVNSDIKNLAEKYAENLKDVKDLKELSKRVEKFTPQEQALINTPAKIKGFTEALQTVSNTEHRLDDGSAKTIAREIHDQYTAPWMKATQTAAAPSNISIGSINIPLADINASAGKAYGGMSETIRKAVEEALKDAKPGEKLGELHQKIESATNSLTVKTIFEKIKDEPAVKSKNLNFDSSNWKPKS